MSRVEKQPLKPVVGNLDELGLTPEIRKNEEVYVRVNIRVSIAPSNKHRDYTGLLSERAEAVQVVKRSRPLS